MSAVDTIRQLAARGVTVRGDSLRADGSVEERGVDVPAAALLISDRAIAYLGAGADRAHAHRLAAIRGDGDEFVLTTEDAGLRLIVGLVAYEDERRALSAAQPPPAAALAEMNELFDALQG